MLDEQKPKPELRLFKGLDYGFSVQGVGLGVYGDI